MNNAKIWLVVKPTVGVPLFLTAVAVGSFAVHVAVLTNTSWVGNFLKGEELGASASAGLQATPVIKPASAPVIDAPTVSDASMDGMLVTLPDGRKARLILEDELAMVTPLQ